MSEETAIVKKSLQQSPRRSSPKKIIIPRRDASLVIPEKRILYVSPDKITCLDCPCFPKEDPFRKPKKLLACQQTPRTLYELAADVVDRLGFPAALKWSEDQVAKWMADVVGFPQYRECIKDNHIDGMRLLMLEDPSKMPEINIHNFEHIKKITCKIRQEYSTDCVMFIRSIGIPPRMPLSHATWFKSRTGPPWGNRLLWTRTDILRWMKILMPEPSLLNHWDLVWFQRQDFPKVMFARIPPAVTEKIPRYKPDKQHSDEYLVPRMFRILKDIPEDKQYIWIQKLPKECKEMMDEIKAFRDRKKKKRKPLKFLIDKDSRLLPKKVSTEGLTGKDLVLARRKMAAPKFFLTN